MLTIEPTWIWPFFIMGLWKAACWLLPLFRIFRSLLLVAFYKKNKLLLKYGKCWAIVTGSSSGIGAEFANQLAEIGFDIILVARRREKLEKNAHAIKKKYNVRTAVISMDLSECGRSEDACSKFLEEVQQIRKNKQISTEYTGQDDIGIFVHAAGFSKPSRHFTDVKRSVNRHFVELNALSTLMLMQNTYALFSSSKK